MAAAILMGLPMRVLGMFSSDPLNPTRVLPQPTDVSIACAQASAGVWSCTPIADTRATSAPRSSRAAPYPTTPTPVWSWPSTCQPCWYARAVASVASVASRLSLLPLTSCLWPLALASCLSYTTSGSLLHRPEGRRMPGHSDVLVPMLFSPSALLPPNPCPPLLHLRCMLLAADQHTAIGRHLGTLHPWHSAPGAAGSRTTMRPGKWRSR